MAEDTERERERAFRILRRHGRASTSFQALEAGFRYFFAGDDAFVAYKDTGRAWVAAGEPVASREHVARAAHAFVEEARRRGRRACFFGVGRELVEHAALLHALVGEEPLWDADAWDETLAGARSLREQLRRARKKGVSTRVLDASEIGRGAPLRARIDALCAHWLDGRRMAPMAFLVQVDPFARAGERIFAIAQRAGDPVALLVAVPVYAGGGWLVEHVFREPDAPNGTTELLVDAFVREVQARGDDWVSLGLAPLSGEVSGPLRLARSVGRPFYNFDGLRAFKARLRPARWEARFLARPKGQSAAATVIDTLVAFTPRGLFPFVAATLRHLRVPLVHALYLLLVPWTLALALSSERWFPSPEVKSAWVAFDILLVVLMAELTRRWRPALVRFLAALTTLDAALTLVQAILYNVPRARGMLDYTVIALAIAAPTLAAALFTFLAKDRR